LGAGRARFGLQNAPPKRAGLARGPEGRRRGQSQSAAWRLAWLLEPHAAEHRLGAPLKSRIVFHNAGKDAVVFRAFDLQSAGGHKARDANGAEINITSTEWTTIAPVIACRLAPGEFTEMTAPGIGIGAVKNEDNWQGTRVGSWIEAKAGDEVTFTPPAVSVHGDGARLEGDAPPDDSPAWWLAFIKNRLNLDAPLPADAAERRRLLDPRRARPLRRRADGRGNRRVRRRSRTECARCAGATARAGARARVPSPAR